MTETKVKPVSMKQAIYRSINDDQWYWTRPSHDLEAFGRSAGPFKTREEARNDFRHKTGVENDNNTK